MLAIGLSFCGGPGIIWQSAPGQTQTRWTAEHTRLCGARTVRQISSDLDNLDCKFDSDSTLSVFLPLCRFLCGSLWDDWSSTLTPDLLIPCQLQWGLQGGLSDCVCMHVWMCVWQREDASLRESTVCAWSLLKSELSSSFLTFLHECVFLYMREFMPLIFSAAALLQNYEVWCQLNNGLWSITT